MINRKMTVVVDGDVIRVAVAGMFSTAENRAYMRITLPSGQWVELRGHHGFSNPWDSPRYIGAAIESMKVPWDESTPSPSAVTDDTDEGQVSLF